MPAATHAIAVYRRRVRHALARRVDAGESISAIARAAGVSRPNLSAWAAGQDGKLSLRAVDDLAAYLGVNFIASQTIDID